METIVFLQAAVGGVFLAAAVAKGASVGSLAPFLTSLGIRETIAMPAGVIVVVIEAAVGVLLVTGVAGLVTACAATSLSIAFAAVQAYAYRSKRRVGCNCFGILDGSGTSPAVALARALILALAAMSLVLLEVLKGTAAAIPTQTEVVSFTIPGLCSGVAVVLAVALVQQVIAFERERPRKRPVSALELSAETSP